LATVHFQAHNVRPLPEADLRGVLNNISAFFSATNLSDEMIQSTLHSRLKGRPNFGVQNLEEVAKEYFQVKKSVMINPWAFVTLPNDYLDKLRKVSTAGDIALQIAEMSSMIAAIFNSTNFGKITKQTL
jgi:hypothetical protein